MSRRLEILPLWVEAVRTGERRAVAKLHRNNTGAARSA
jgi:hypothetical protein